MSRFEKYLNSIRASASAPGVRAGTILCLSGLLLSADTLTLRNGQVLQGTYIGGNARQLQFDQNGDVRSYDIGRVQSLMFSDADSQPAPPPPPPQASYPRERSARDVADDRGPRSSQTSGLTIPADTSITVRMIDAVNSETSSVGQTYRASVDEPIYVNGQEVVPRGTDVVTKLIGDQQSGKIQGRTALTLVLYSMTVNGRTVDVTSSDVRTESSSRGARSGKVIGGTAAVGAIIGAIAGGGKGAAIGAGSGAAVGTGAEVLTGGQKVKIPSETRLTFRLQNPAYL